MSVNNVLSDGSLNKIAGRVSIPELGTAALRDATSVIEDDSTSLIEAGAVYNALQEKVDESDLGDAAYKDLAIAIEEDSTSLVEAGIIYNALQEKANISSLGTAAAKDSTSTISAGSVDLIEAGPVYNALQNKANSSDLGTAAAKDSTSTISAGSVDLIEAGAVKTYVDNKVVDTFKQGGSKTCAELTSSLLIADNKGYVYNMTDTGSTTSDFIEGAGKPIDIGNNVAVIEVSTGVYKFNILGGSSVDLSDYIQKSSTAGLIKNDGTIDTNTYLTSSDITGKANKSEMSVTNGTGTDVDKTTIQLKSGTSATVLRAHQDISGKVDTSVIGEPNGVASLGSDGKVPSSQLPSYVDDVLEYASSSNFPTTGESGKIYVALDTNKTYRWTGSTYTEISPSLALGETSSTAYRGDRGKAAYDHSQDSGRITAAVSSGLYKVAATAQGHVAGLTAVQKSDITALGIPAQDTTYSAATTSANGLMSSTDKAKINKINEAHYLTSASSTDKIKININSTAQWMLSFVVSIYQSYRATRIQISGYNIGNDSHWYQPEAVLLSDSDNDKLNVYFGYDSQKNLWVGFDGGNYTGVSIDCVTNGHKEVTTDYTGLFTISRVATLETIQTTLIPYSNHYTEAPTASQVLIASSANGGIKTSGYTIAKSVPSSAVFTDANVAQTNLANTDANARRVLLSNSANDTTETKGSYKNTQLQFTPSTGVLSTPKFNAKVLTITKTGTGTAGQDKGSGVSPRYFPAKWTFNLGYSPTEGDIVTITIPVAGHTNGVFVSIDNGTSYHPANVASTSRLTTQYGVGVTIQLVFDADGTTNDMYALNGADARAAVTGGCWRVINYYDSNSNTIPSAYCDTAAATAAKAASCTNYNLLDKSYLHVLVVNANTSASALTLNVNSKGAKSIYINGTASSATNYTLPAGTYLVYYASNIYYFRTDGKITGDITGNAATVNGLTVQTAVPASAVFTDAKVTQTATTTSANYEVLFSATADNTTRTEGARKNSNILANPNTGLLQSTQTKSTVNKSMLTGTGTAGQDKGSGVSPRYFPAKWTFNTGITVADGDMFTIKIPVAGHSYGVFLSVNNGTNYYPVGYNTNTAITTHFPVGAIITVVFKSDGVVNSIYAVAGGDSKVNVSGGAFYVLDLYDSGNSNTYDRNRYNAAIKVWGTALVAANIIVANTSGLYMHLKQNAAFDITYPILYLNEAVAANGTTTNTYDIINFATATTQSGTWTAYKPVFIKGQLNGTIFTPVSATPLTQTIPTSADGYEYILLGIATATTTVYLQERHPIYAYQNGRFGEYNYVFDALGIAENTSF